LTELFVLFFLLADMSFMKFIRDGEMGSEESLPNTQVDADVPEVPRDAEVSSRPPSAEVPNVTEGVGTSVAADEVRAADHEEREPDVQITGVIEGVSAGVAAADGGIASRLRRRRGSSPLLDLSKKRKRTKVSAGASDQMNHGARLFLPYFPYVAFFLSFFVFLLFSLLPLNNDVCRGQFVS
jgi:hypothetical protein